ncbi:alpha-mannosidase [Paenibacillus sp. FSL H7-0756]|uniref:alpha-mannosidase n=1 Tax=Paenibacillus sp. FSL H7-0756 TaxID=2954738 RepID=UPI0030F86B2E
MWWTVEKLGARIAELEDLRYRERREMKGLLMKRDTAGSAGAYPDESGEWIPVTLGDRWKGRDEYYWLAANVDIPAQWLGKTVVARFELGTSGGGNNSGFESLMFLNGSPYQGVDSNHGEVRLPDGLCGTSAALHLRMWSGLGGYQPDAVMEHQLSRAELSVLDEAADDLYYTGKACLGAAASMADHQAERHALLQLLDQAFRALDWSEPGAESFYTSAGKALTLLRAGLAALPKHSAVTVQCIGHTHIDVAWLWRLKHTRDKAARSFSTVLRLMEQYPEYVFLQTMPQLYEYIKEDYPQIYQEIKQRVAEGRWEAGGGMWLEADCNLTSGESLVRQLLYGTRFFQKEFGVECKYLWLPDVFGYSWALPQILKKSGIEAFMTTKISWNQYNRMPHDTFKWRGIDGTEITTHFITTPDSGASEGAFYYTYNGSITADSVQGIWESYQDKALNQTLLLAYGYGDGGGGVNREMLEMRRRLDEIPGMPNVTTGRADDYFRELEQRLEESEQYIHVWDGELYLELHRGTYTSQAHNKRMNRKLELMLRRTEWLSVLAYAQGKAPAAYPAGTIADIWTIVLRNQFHDIIPGSSIREVYEDSRAEYETAERLASEVWRRAAAAFILPPAAGKAVTVLNSASWARDGLVCLKQGEGGEVSELHTCWNDSAGARLLTQRTHDGNLLVYAEALPALDYVTWTAAAPETAVSVIADHDPFNWKTNGITTPFYDIEWNESGQITLLYDRQCGRTVLEPGQCGNVLQTFEDKPKSRHEAWDIDIFYTEKMETVTGLEAVTLLESGPLRAVIHFCWMYKNSRIEQRMIVYTRSRRIDWETELDWHEQRRLLKVAFPVQIRAVEATYDIQFGNVSRPTHWNTSWDAARFETVGHQWADLSERGYGVSLLNDCKYGYDIKDAVMRLTLVKSAMVPDPQADQGRHIFTYALLPHEGDWIEGCTVQEAWDLNDPLQYAAGASELSRQGFLQIDCDHIMVDAVKLAEEGDAVIIRLHEFTGRRGTVVLSTEWPDAVWQECDLMEHPVGSPSCGQRYETEITPYEIRTLKLRFL